MRRERSVKKIRQFLSQMRDKKVRIYKCTYISWTLLIAYAQLFISQQVAF